MIKLNVNITGKGYPIYISTNYDELGKYLHTAGITGQIVIITDENVGKYYLEECAAAVSNQGYEVFKYVIKPGEVNKNLDTVRDIYKFLTELKIDRKATLLALGGGVTGDITGFVAATYLRGINFVQVPTSLLAQADSSVGGKVGVDFEGNKNVVGAFYQPKLVYINVNVLKTLPVREIQSGLAEVVKHGLIMDSDFFDFVDYNIKKIFSFDPDVLSYMTKMNCSIKANIVEQDEKENDLRAILNFGHTIGHAIESVSDFKLTHGESIAIGFVGAYKIANALGMVDGHLIERIEAVLQKIGLPVKTEGMDVESVYKRMFHDKKAKNGKLVFILPKKIGEVLQCTIDDEALIKKVLKDLVE